MVKDEILCLLWMHFRTPCKTFDIVLLKSMLLFCAILSVKCFANLRNVCLLSVKKTSIEWKLYTIMNSPISFLFFSNGCIFRAKDYITLLGDPDKNIKERFCKNEHLWLKLVNPHFFSSKLSTAVLMMTSAKNL